MNIKLKLKSLFSVVLLSFVLCGCTTLFQKDSQTSTAPAVQESAQVKETSPSLEWDETVKVGQLSNGMKFYVKNNKKPENRISLRLVVRAGSNMEEDDQKGVAHFVEHMCFNGTKNFKKSAIVDYFESIGMKFGPEVNAYTSFEETVYKLELPADDINMLKTGLLVLHDWASEVSFEQEEIDKERGVVTEEWRGNQGLQGRLTQSQLNFLLKGSKFQNRLPIGDMDVIKNISRKRIVDFFKANYRPENMAVIAVGDIDVETLEKEIKAVMETIPASKDKYERKSFKVPVQRGKNICVFKDPEVKYTLVNIFYRQSDFKPTYTEDDVKKDFIKNMAAVIFNQRLREITNTKESPWLDAGYGDLSFTDRTMFFYAGIAPKEGQFETSLKRLLDEQDRLVEFGITETELERTKTTILSAQEKSYKNRDKIYSTKHADSIVNADLLDDLVISEEDFYEIVKKLIPSITVEEVNASLKKTMKKRGELMYVMAPESNKEVLTEAKLSDIWKNYKNADLAKYEEEALLKDLVEKPSKKAKIVTQRELPAFEAKEYVLENGVKIVVKKTDNEKDTIRMKAVSFGGSNLISDKDYPSSLISIDYAIHSGFKNLSYNQFIKMISSKQISISGNMSDTYESLSGASTNGDFSTFVQVINLLFTGVNFNDEGWNVVYDNYTTTAKGHGKQPMDVFIDKLIEDMYGDDIRYKSMDEEVVKKINKKTAEKLYKERYNDISDFTFYFVGDIDEKNLLDNCRTYLGTIPTEGKKEKIEYLTKKFPKGIKEDVVYKGQDKGYVTLCFGGEMGPAKDEREIYKDRQIMNLLSELLTIRLREVIREDKSGSYGVSVYSSILSSPNREYYVFIEFGCEPERAEELKKEVIKQVEIVRKELVNDEYITKLMETYKRNRETNLKDNGWILNTLVSASYFKELPEDIYTNNDYIPGFISKKTFKEYAAKYLDTNNYISVFLKPEK